MDYQNIKLLLNNRFITKKDLRLFQKFLLKSESYAPYLMRINYNCWSGGIRNAKKQNLLFDAFPWYDKDDPLAPPKAREINKLLPENVEWVDLHNTWMGYIEKQTH